MKSKLPVEVVTALYAHLLHKLSNEDLIKIIKHNLSDLKPLIKQYDEFIPQIIRRLELVEGDFHVDLIYSIWGESIDLKKLDKLRWNQVQENHEIFVGIKSINRCLGWLSGGTTIEYCGNDNSYHSIKVNYPFDNLKILPNKLVGAIYFDERLVPITSDLEIDILNGLNTSLLKNEEFEEVINFIKSENYYTIAKKIGRIS